MSISPPLHHVQYTSSIHPLQGFHFAITVRLLSNPPSECPTLGLSFVLPPSVFADPYELDLYRNTFAYKLSVHPDLELPVTAVDSANTILDVNATVSSSDQPPIITIPIHARYAKPGESTSNPSKSIHLEHPRATLFCRFSDSSSMTLDHQPSPGDMIIRVPLGLTSDSEVVEAGTFIVIFTAFIYLSFVFLKTARRLNMGYHNKME